MNKKQKYISIITAILIAVTAGLWIGTGAHIFTKQQIAVEQKDELLGTSYIVWEDVTMVGLDIALPAAIGLLLAGAIGVYFSRTKRKSVPSNNKS
jgi:hypothetical protein